MAGRLPGLIPIVVGVTGHRDLCIQDIPRLEEAVRELLLRLQREYPSSPLVLITPLAEGADRLVARVVLELGGELIVPLPLPRAEYEKDFPDAVAEFAQLLKDERMVRRIDLPALRFHAPEEGILSSEARRTLQYALAGAYVARHSQVLIALWDGKASDSIGGTAQIVQFRRTGRFDFADALGQSLEEVPDPFGLPATPLDPRDTGPVYHVVTPRAGDPSPSNPFFGRWLTPEQSAAEAPDQHQLPAALSTSLARIEAFNADAVSLAGRDPGTIAASEVQLYGETHRQVPPTARGLRHAFALADALALRYQGETYRVLAFLYGLAFLAVLCFETYAHIFPPEDPRVIAFLAAYLGVLGVADLLYLFSRHRRSQHKFQDYRALAEGLRVQFYWRIAGLPHSGADYYLHKQRDELAWIREALRAWSVRSEPVTESDVPALLTRWIESQRDYFIRATRRERDRLTRYRAIAGGVILASLIWAVPTAAETLRELPKDQFNWLQAFRVPLLLVSLVLAWHIGFKGSQMLRGPRARASRGSLKEARTFVLSAVLAIAFLAGMRALAAWAHARWPLLPEAGHAWVVVGLGVVTVVGALVHSYTDKRAFGEHARQYSRMAEVFTRAGERMAALLHDSKHERARILAVELGKEALTEHGDWLMLHRERPIQPPKVEL